MTITIQDIREKIIGGGVIVDIGQITDAQRKQLKIWVKSGNLAQWRGKWFPVAGASFGLGPDKTCWGLPEVRESLNFKIKEVA